MCSLHCGRGKRNGRGKQLTSFPARLLPPPFVRKVTLALGLGRFQATFPQLVKLKLQSCIRRIPLHLFVCVPFPCCAQTMPLHAKRKTTAFVVVVMIALACEWRDLAFLQQLALPNLWRPCLLLSSVRRRINGQRKEREEREDAQ